MEQLEHDIPGKNKVLSLVHTHTHTKKKQKRKVSTMLERQQMSERGQL